MFNHEPFLASKDQLQVAPQIAGCLGIEGILETVDRVRIEVINHQRDGFDLRKICFRATAALLQPGRHVQTTEMRFFEDL